MGKKTAPRPYADNEAMAFSKHIRVSAQKLNLVASLIRGLDCEKAISELTFSKRRIAQDVKKVLESAIANAENNHDLDVDRLYVAEAYVGRTMVMNAGGPVLVAVLVKFLNHSAICASLCANARRQLKWVRK